MKATSVPTTRRYDLDWLRVLLILTVLVFHSTRFFDLDGWHVKNATTYMSVQIFVTFVSRWMMPAIFIISGAATYLALGKRSPGRFLKDRVLRLLVPLIVGIFTHIPLQGYLELVSHNQFSGSFWEFYKLGFHGLAGLGGNFNWVGNHLWYLEMLFIFSVIFLPLFIWMRHGSGQGVLTWLGNLLSTPGAVYLLVLPTFIILIAFNPEASWVLTGSSSFGGWSTLNHIVFFLTGFVMMSSMGMQMNIRRLRWISLAVGILTFLVGGYLYLVLGENAQFGSANYLLLNIFNALIGWSWILAILGFGMQRLNFRTPLLDYAGEAVMPFYIFHQTVLLVVGFFVVRWAIPDFVKWLIILPGSFVIIMALYEFTVRRISFMRVLFGMKPVQKRTMVQQSAVQVS
jgi:hypothetical protein